MNRKRDGLLLIATSLLAALTLEMVPLPPPLQLWQPPWLLLIVLFWNLHRPGSVGMTIAWLTGLLLDGALGSPLGTHALLFTITTTFVLLGQRLLHSMPMIQQALWMALLAFLHQFVAFAMGGGFDSASASLMPQLAPTISVLLAWPLINIALLNPRRRMMP
ncbi:MAG: rod shape-determining protein MreD [Pseudomonadota bacterium]